MAHGVSHGIGVALSIGGLAVLVATAALRGDARLVASVAVFGTTLVLLYTASTLYHSIPVLKAKRVLRILDHSAIYLLIAGTYTPFTLITLNGPWGWTIFGIEWGLALAGIIYKVFFYDEKHRGISTAVYLLMGWMALIAIKPLIGALHPGGLIWLGIGGLSYSLGVIFYLWRSLPFAHVIWHLFVLGGSISHFFAVFFYT